MAAHVLLRVPRALGPRSRVLGGARAPARAAWSATRAAIPDDPAAGSAARPRGADSAEEPSLARVLAIVRPYVWPADRPDVRARVVASVGLMVGSKLSAVGVPFLLKDAVDALAAQAPAEAPASAAAAAETALELASANGSMALGLIAAYAVLRVASIGMQEARSAIFASVSHGASRALARSLFAQLHARGPEFHARTPAAVLSRMVERSMRAAHSLLSVLVLHIAPTALEMALVGGLLGTRCGAPAAALAGLTVGVYVAFTFDVTVRRNAQRRRMNREDNALHAEFGDSLANRELVRLHGGLALARARYERRLASHEASQVEVFSSLAWLNFGQGAIFAGGVGAVTLHAAWRCVLGELSVGDVILANGLLLQLAVPLNLLGMVHREYHSAVTDLGASLRLLERGADGGADGGGATTRGGAAEGAATRVLDGASVRAHGIEFDGVRFRYGGGGGGGAGGSCAAERGGGGGGGAGIVDVSFRVPFGRTLAIVGESGSGKSTVLRLLSQQVEPHAGAVRVGGTDVRSLAPDSLRAAVVVVSQESSLFHSTVEYNVGYPLLAARARAHEARLLAARPRGAGAADGALLVDTDGDLSRLRPAEARAVRAAAERAQLGGASGGGGTAGCAEDDTRRLLARSVGVGGAQMSGGERQRVNLARAFARLAVRDAAGSDIRGAVPPNADAADADTAAAGADGRAAAGAERAPAGEALVLLCDEPTSALDALTEARVLGELRAASAERCTVLVAHRLSTVAHADEILVLADGRVAERGTHDELVRRPGGVYARMWRTQSQQGELGVDDFAAD